jgi:hypothetical protein
LKFIFQSDFYIEDNYNVTQFRIALHSRKGNSNNSHKLTSSPLHRKSRALRTLKHGAQGLPILSDNEDLNKELLNDASGDDDIDLIGRDDGHLTTVKTISTSLGQDFVTSLSSNGMFSNCITYQLLTHYPTFIT